jgi:outer membrane protein assembly factor BamB
MGATLGESTRAINFLAFGILALAAASRMVTRDFTAATVGHVLSLWLIAWLGYQCATTVVRRSRIPGVVGFVVGWFWMPIVALVPLALWWWIQRPPKRSGRNEAPQAARSGDRPAAARTPKDGGGALRMRECWRHAIQGRNGMPGEYNAGSFSATEHGVVFTSWRPDRQGRSTVHVVSISPEGEARWDLERTETPDSHVFGRHVYVGGPTAVCFDMETGARIAERDFSREVDVQPASDLGPTYWLEPDGPLVGLNPTTLETVWEWKEGLGVHGTFLCWCGRDVITIVPLQDMQAKEIRGPFGDLHGWHGHFGDLLCVVGLAEGGGRIAVSQSTGEIMWRGDEPRACRWVGFGPATAYSTDGPLEAWDLQTGNRIWSRQFDAAIQNLPTEAHGRVHVATRDGTVHLLDAKDGGVLATHALKHRRSGSLYEPSPVLPWGEKRILVGTQREIICLEVE